MYQVTPLDREPVTLFGKPYVWIVNDEGRLSLILVGGPHFSAKLDEAMAAIKKALA